MSPSHELHATLAQRRLNFLTEPALVHAILRFPAVLYLAIKRLASEPEQSTLLFRFTLRCKRRETPSQGLQLLIHLYDIMGEYVDKTGRRPTRICAD